MEKLEREVRRARRRLAFQRFLRNLGWCWFAALLAALVPVVVFGLHPLTVGVWVWPVGALVLGVLAAMVWTGLVLPRPLEAALEIDRRFGLKERISSTLALGPEDRQSEAGQALVADAAVRLRRIDVGDRFPVRLPRQILLPLAPGLAVVLLAVLIRPAGAEATPAPVVAQAAEKQPEIKKSAEALRQKLAQRSEQAKKEGLKDATELLKKLEEGSKELQAEPNHEKALVKLNDLGRMLEQRRKELGGGEKFKQQLEQLKSVPQGPADKFNQALSKGDFKSAADELEQLKKELADSKLDDAKKEQVAKQLDDLQKKLKQMADDAKGAQDDLRKQAKQLRQDGQDGDASKLEEQIDKLLAQAPSLQKLSDLADKLGQCSQCMQQGQGDQANQALQDALGQLRQLQKDVDEMQMLDGAMRQLAQAREQMNCPKCGGAGCKECQGEGGEDMEGMAMGEGQGGKDGQPGMGLGPGKGNGPRPEKKTGTALYDSRVKQKVGRGSGTVTDLVTGPNVRGQAEEAIRKEAEAVQRGTTDPLSGQHLPKKHREQAREYYDRIREGK